MAKALLHELGRSLSFGRLSLLGKVLWPMLLSASDDQGRGLAEPDTIRWHVCPNVDELTKDTIHDALSEMVVQEMIHLYRDDRGRWLYQIIAWWEYQQLAWAQPSRYAAPDGWTDRVRHPPGKRPRWLRKRKETMRRYGWICQYCGSKAVEIDHIIPRCQGGTDDMDNLVAACFSCNRSKGGRTPEEAEMELKDG